MYSNMFVCLFVALALLFVINNKKKIMFTFVQIVFLYLIILYVCRSVFLSNQNNVFIKHNKIRKWCTI